MWRRALVLTLLALPAVPGVAIAGPPPPDPPAPALAGAPYLVRSGARHATLYLRLTRPLARRFDGELLATAVIDGRFSSLAAVPGRLGRACYSASVIPRRSELGRVYTTVLLVDGAEPVTTLLALRARRPGDARGAPLRC